MFASRVGLSCRTQRGGESCRENKRHGEGALTGLDELENVADHSEQAAGFDATEVLARVHRMIQQLNSPDRQIVFLSM
jgi:DNA-directed RNA polymerase specialized sigma24 family protein